MDAVSPKQATPPAKAHSHAERLSEYSASLEHALTSDLRPKVESSRPAWVAIGSVDRFNKAAQGAVARFRQDYELVADGVGKEARDVRKTLADSEESVIRGIDEGLKHAFALSQAVDNGGSSRAIHRAALGLEQAASHLENYGAPVPQTMLTAIHLALPSLRAKVQTIASFAYNFFGLGSTLFQTVHAISIRPLLRPETRTEGLTFTGWNPEQRQDRNGIYIIVGNHDYAFADVICGERTARRFGVTEPFVLGTETAYPMYKLRKHREDNVIFIQDKNPLEAICSRMRARPADEAQVLLVTPEGTLPRFHAQFPLYPKRGAFAEAALLANKFAGERNVYLVPVTSNGLEHISGREAQSLTAEIHPPQLVPVKDRRWPEQACAEFAALVDAKRAPRIVDLANPDMVPGFNVPFSTARACAVGDTAALPLLAGAEVAVGSNGQVT